MTSATWAMHGSVLVRAPASHNPQPETARVAGFDWDGTLATYTGAGKCWASLDSREWRWFNTSVAQRLRDVHASGYRICVFSNQAGLLRAPQRMRAVRERLDHFLEQLGDVPVRVYVACDRDEYRKPGTGMWQLMCSHFSSGPACTPAESFYVGDAAGRAGDFADSDVQFACAVGVGAFFTPEDMFHVHPPSQLNLVTRHL